MFNRPARAVPGFVPCILMALALALAACGGGMVGTGTGPYRLENLPERISPDLPYNVIQGEEPTPEQSDTMDNETYPTPRMNDIDAVKARGWKELTFHIEITTFQRLTVESSATIIDLAFNDIQEACADQMVNCTIPKGQIRVKLTQDVIDRLINLHTNWVVNVASFDAEGRESSIEGIVSVFTSLLDTYVVLDETRYSQGGDMPYEHSVQTTLKREAFPDDILPFVRWNDEKFDARWVDDGQVVRYVTSNKSYTLEYFYENNEPGEVAVSLVHSSFGEVSPHGFYTKIVGNDPNKAGVLVDMAFTKILNPSRFSDDSASASVPVEEDGSDSELADGRESPQSDEVDAGSDSDSYSGLGYDFVRGQLDNRGGYTSVRSLDKNAADLSLFYELYRESFDSIGTLLAGEDCTWDFSITPSENCGGQDLVAYGPEGGALTDSVHYFEPDGFDSLLAMQDSIRWSVQGLPVNIQAVAVVSADNAIPLSEREFLCRGFQYVAEDVRIFCVATDEQLENTLVVELVDGKVGAVIPEASLEQIQ